MSRGGFRGGRGGAPSFGSGARGGGRGGFTSDRGFRGAARGRGGFGGGDRGGYGGYNAGPPDEVFEMGKFVHACEGEMVCESTNTKVPYFNAPIYLQNKTSIGKVDEILGPINQVFFTIKTSEGVQPNSFQTGDKVYIAGDKLLPLERFLPKPKPPPGTKVEKRGRGRGAPGGGRGRGAAGGRGGRGAPRGGRGGFAPRGRGAPGGMRGGGGFSRGGARGSSFGGRGGGRGRGGY